jgi:hypothetical protein
MTMHEELKGIDAPQASPLAAALPTGGVVGTIFTPNGRVLGIDLGPEHARASLHGRGVVSSVDGITALPKILTRLLAQAEAVTGEAFVGAVVSTPVGLDFRQRVELEAVFAEARLPLLRTISGPVAAALVAPEILGTGSELVVIDMRGGACDMAAIWAEDGVLTVRAVRFGRRRADAVAGIIKEFKRLETDVKGGLDDDCPVAIVGAGADLAEQLCQHLGQVRDVDEDQIARGLAILAGVLEGRVRDVVLLGAQAVSLGLLLASTDIVQVIERNASLPVTRTQTFFSNEKNPTHVDLFLWAGGPGKVSRDDYQGAVLGLPLTFVKGGRARIEVTFEVDTSGAFCVTTSGGAAGSARWPLVVTIKAPDPSVLTPNLPSTGGPSDALISEGDFAFLGEQDFEELVALLLRERTKTVAELLGAIAPGFVDLLLYRMPLDAREKIIQYLGSQPPLTAKARTSLIRKLRRRLGLPAEAGLDILPVPATWWQRTLTFVRCLARQGEN